jgi:hypothetical protein
MKRQRAVELVEELLRNLDEQRNEWPLRLIREVNVFGSFARGALEPHDVDLSIEHDMDDEMVRKQVSLFSRGRNPTSLFRKPLLKGRRGCEVLLNQGREWADDFFYLTLWKRGDTLEAALRRLHSIPVDETAGRAPRDAMIPEFEGLDHWLPLWLREELIDLVESGAVKLDRLRIDDAEATAPEAAAHIADRWVPTSPLFRAANAAVAHLEGRGVDAGSIHLHGMDIRDRTTPFYVGLGLRYLTSAGRCLTEEGGEEWIEVVHPTRTRPLDCLRIVPLDARKLAPSRFDGGS